MATATRNPAPLRVAIAVLAIAALATFYVRGVHPNLFPKNFAVVEPGKVYRSGQLTPAAFRKVVEERGIKTIIDLGSGKDHPEVEKLNASVARSMGVSRYVAELEGDSRGNPNWYVWALRIATDPANQPVLIHCGAGSERTGCLVALYDHVSRGTPLDVGYENAKQHGHDADRNPWLKKTMADFGPAAILAYRANAWIPGMPAVPLGGTTGAPVPAAVANLPAPTSSTLPTSPGTP